MSWCLDLHFFFLWSQWNASHIPGENVIQPKNKFDDLVHNLYTAKRSLKGSHNSRLSVLTGCRCRPLRRGATASLHSGITRGGPECLILGRQRFFSVTSFSSLLSPLSRSSGFRILYQTLTTPAHISFHHLDDLSTPCCHCPFFSLCILLHLINSIIC